MVWVYIVPDFAIIHKKGYSMRFFLFLFLSFSSLYSISYPTLYKVRGSGYLDSHVSITGKFTRFTCYDSPSYTKDRRDYCKVSLTVYDNDVFVNHVALHVGTTWKSDFKSSRKGDIFSFGCTYKGDYTVFKDCK